MMILRLGSSGAAPGPETGSEVVDLRRQLVIIRGWLPVLAASVLIAGAGAFMVSLRLPGVYEAKAILVVGQSLSAANPDYNQLLASQQLSATYASVATTRPILDTVTRQLGLNVSADQLARRVQAAASSGSSLLTISAQDGDPSRAAAIANAVADQLIATSSTIQGGMADLQASVDAELQATLEQIDAAQAEVERLGAIASPSAGDVARLQVLQAQLATLRSTYASLLLVSNGGAGRVSVVEPAVAPSSPVAPNPLLNTLVAAVLGLVLAAGMVFVAEYVDDTVKDSGGVQDVANLGTLGTIPRMQGDAGRSEAYRLVGLLYPHSLASEGYRTLRTNIEFASVDRSIHTLVVTSSTPGEGKTVTAANLAVVFAQAGRRVLLVDTDLRRAGIHSLFGLQNSRGVTTLLRGEEASVDELACPTEQDNLRVLTAGPLPPNPAELLGSQRMHSIVEQLKASAELVIFDSPPLQAVSDAAILGSFLDGTLLVIRAGRTRRSVVRQGRDALARAGATVLGAVLNRVSTGSHYVDYYRGYSEAREPHEGIAERSHRATP